MGRFKTEVLTQGANLAALADLWGRYIHAVHARYTVFQMADPRDLLRRILELIDSLKPCETARC